MFITLGKVTTFFVYAKIFRPLPLRYTLTKRRMDELLTLFVFSDKFHNDENNTYHY